MERKEYKTGALITSSPKETSEWISKRGIVTLPFERRGIHAFFSSLEPENMENMASFKERDWKSPNGIKPFVITFPIENVEKAFIGNSGISSEVPKKVIESISKVLIKASTYKEKPLGILIPANESLPPQRLLGKILVDNKKIPTIGFMVSGGNTPNYKSVVRELKEVGLAGTSANFSRDYRANGSGHSHLGGLIAQFSRQEKLCIFVPEKIPQRISTSTSVVYISKEGKAYINRRGSLSDNELMALFGDANIPIVGQVDKPVTIQPYDYSGYKFMWAVQIFAISAIRKSGGGIRIPENLSEIIENTVLPTDVKEFISKK